MPNLNKPICKAISKACSSTISGSASGGAPAWTPAELSPSLWLDASDASTITGDPVSQWDDKGALGNDVTQGTGSQQPDTGADTINGLNCLSTTGTDDQLMTAASAIEYTDFTIAIVFNPTLTGTAMFFGNDADSNEYAYFQSSGNIRIKVGGLTKTATTQITDTDSYVVFKRDGATLYIIVNGNEYSVAIGTGSANFNRVLGYVGADSEFRGYMGEMIFIPSALGTDDQALLDTYINDKWGV